MWRMGLLLHYIIIHHIIIWIRYQDITYQVIYVKNHWVYETILECTYHVLTYHHRIIIWYLILHVHISIKAIYIVFLVLESRLLILHCISHFRSMAAYMQTWHGQNDILLKNTAFGWGLILWKKDILSSVCFILYA